MSQEIHRCRRLLLLALLTIATLVEPAVFVQGQTTPHLTMTVTGQSLTAGFNNTVTITLQNNYYSTIYDTTITVTMPSGLTLIGAGQWHYDLINLGQTVNVRFQVYAPTSAIGTTYLGSVGAAYRQLGDISYTQESHALSLSVYGYIKLLVYAVQATPSSTTPGGNATISGNVLNTGNLAAYNANVTVKSDVLVPSSSSSAFIGEVDPNIPRPFSLVAFFKTNLPVGNYSITVMVSAIDTSRPIIPITAQQDTRIEIRRPTPTTQRQQAPRGIVEVIIQILRYLYDMFIGSLTGILTPLRWPVATYSSLGYRRS